MALMPYANSEGPDQTAHAHSLIWAFPVRRYIIQYPMIPLESDECPDRTANTQAG